MLSYIAYMHRVSLQCEHLYVSEGDRLQSRLSHTASIHETSLHSVSFHGLEKPSYQ
jgi:hypothetical protein